MTTLLDVPEGQCARLAAQAGRLRTRLMQVGLYRGDEVRVVRSAPLGGPVLVDVNGREIALGRAVAEKVQVELPCVSP